MGQRVGQRGSSTMDMMRWDSLARDRRIQVVPLPWPGQDKLSWVTPQPWQRGWGHQGCALSHAQNPASASVPRSAAPFPAVGAASQHVALSADTSAST